MVPTHLQDAECFVDSDSHPPGHEIHHKDFQLFMSWTKWAQQATLQPNI
jgi:hypothetical protein